MFIVEKNISITFVEKYRTFYTHAFSVALYWWSDVTHCC